MASSSSAATAVARNRRRILRVDILSVELIQEILSRLPISSLSQTRYVSQTWRGVINDPTLALLHYTESFHQSHPITTLLLYTKQDSEMYCIPDISHPKPRAIKLTNLPFKSWLPKFKVIGSVNGFICVADDSGEYRSIFVCNPVTGDSFLVPDNDNVCGNVEGVCFGFGYSAETKEYKIVKFRYILDEKYCEVDIHTLGSETWRNLGRVKQVIDGRWDEGIWNFRNKRSMASCGVLVSGNLHWLGILDDSDVISIIVVDLADETIQDKVPTSIERIVGEINQQHRLGELGGDLIIVDDSSDECANIWVMEEYGFWGSWTKKYIIARPVAFYSSIDTPICFRPLLLDKGGQILMEINEEVLILYHPIEKTFGWVDVGGLPNSFRVVPHVGMLASVDQAIQAKGI